MRPRRDGSKCGPSSFASFRRWSTREQVGADLLLVLRPDPAAAAAVVGAVLLAIGALAVLPGALALLGVARGNSVHVGARERQVLT